MWPMMIHRWPAVKPKVHQHSGRPSRTSEARSGDVILVDSEVGKPARPIVGSTPDLFQYIGTNWAPIRCHVRFLNLTFASRELCRHAAWVTGNLEQRWQSCHRFWQPKGRKFSQVTQVAQGIRIPTVRIGMLGSLISLTTGNSQA